MTSFNPFNNIYSFNNVFEHCCVPSHVLGSGNVVMHKSSSLILLTVNISYSEAQSGSYIEKITLVVCARSWIDHEHALFSKRTDCSCPQEFTVQVRGSLSVIQDQQCKCHLLEIQISDPPQIHWIRNSGDGLSKLWFHRPSWWFLSHTDDWDPLV